MLRACSRGSAPACRDIARGAAQDVERHLQLFGFDALQDAGAQFGEEVEDVLRLGAGGLGQEDAAGAAVLLLAILAGRGRRRR